MVAPIYYQVSVRGVILPAWALSMKDEVLLVTAHILFEPDQIGAIEREVVGRPRLVVWTCRIVARIIIVAAQAHDQPATLDRTRELSGSSGASRAAVPPSARHLRAMDRESDICDMTVAAGRLVDPGTVKRGHWGRPRWNAGEDRHAETKQSKPTHPNSSHGFSFSHYVVWR